MISMIAIIYSRDTRDLENRWEETRCPHISLITDYYALSLSVAVSCCRLIGYRECARELRRLRLGFRAIFGCVDRVSVIRSGCVNAVQLERMGAILTH